MPVRQAKLASEVETDRATQAAHQVSLRLPRSTHPTIVELDQDDQPPLSHSPS